MCIVRSMCRNKTNGFNIFLSIVEGVHPRIVRRIMADFESIQYAETLVRNECGTLSISDSTGHLESIQESGPIELVFRIQGDSFFIVGAQV